MIPSTVSKFAISPNGKYCVIGSSTGTIFVFNIDEGYLEEAYDEQHNVAVLGVDWAPGTQSSVATIDKTGCLFLWN